MVATGWMPANFSNAQQNAVIMTIASNEPGIFFEILGVKTMMRIDIKPMPKAHQFILLMFSK